MSNKLMLQVAVTAVTVFLAGQALADQNGSYANGYYPGGYTFTPGYGYGYGYGRGYGASTVAGGYLHGAAAAIRAQGEFNANTALAAKILQESRSLRLANRVKSVEAYYALKERNRQYVDATRKPRPTDEQIRRFNAARAPARLDQQEVDAVSGVIFWPPALQSDEFAGARQELQRVFRDRARLGGLSIEDRQKAVELSQETRDTLKEHIRELQSNDYLAAKKFIDSIAYEVRFTPQIDGVAAR